MNPRSRKTNPSNKRGANQNTRPLKHIAYFYVEGKTEEEYIRLLIDERYSRVVTAKFPPISGSSLKNLIQSARKQAKLEEDESIWIICDTDKNKQHLPLLEKWIGQGPKTHKVVISNPCIEAWFLAHYTTTISSISATGVTSQLKQHLPNYKKGARLHRSLISNTETALQNMRHRGRSTGSIYEIWPTTGVSNMDSLIGFLETLLRQKSLDKN